MTYVGVVGAAVVVGVVVAGGVVVDPPVPEVVDVGPPVVVRQEESARNFGKLQQAEKNGRNMHALPG